ncbi:hypothetical protein [Hoylesella marshii]|uniref:hypothetical protein n=1 Tax=Hoylesella marshii TaxID=189722 RepID=UPI000468BC39|nr:hypothetical protein [Hoylesella marshii]
MKKKPFRKQPYVSPAIEVIRTPFDNLLLSSSFNNSGGHKEADDEDWKMKTLISPVRMVVDTTMPMMKNGRLPFLYF